MAEILGMNVIADEILKNPSQVSEVKTRGQIIFVWTDDKNDRSTVDYLKKIGVDGIVYDRMDENNSKEVKESVFLVDNDKDKHEHGEEKSCSCASNVSSSSNASSVNND